MTPETPLPEVARHLPQAAAAILDQHSEGVQVYVLTQIRAIVVYWETQRYVFDPVAYEGILNAFVVNFAPLAAEIQRLNGDVAILQSQLLGADILIRTLRGGQ